MSRPLEAKGERRKLGRSVSAEDATLSPVTAGDQLTLHTLTEGLMIIAVCIKVGGHACFGLL